MGQVAFEQKIKKLIGLRGRAKQSCIPFGGCNMRKDTEAIHVQTLVIEMEGIQSNGNIVNVKWSSEEIKLQR
jgi:hypothetical protein